jgi:hypothetical protein
VQGGYVPRYKGGIILLCKVDLITKEVIVDIEGQGQTQKNMQDTLI